MLEQLKGRTRKLVERNMTEGENVEFVIAGAPNQVIVALQDRVLVVKHGYMAGATFGGKVTSFDYKDITGVEIQSGMFTAVIEISSPSYQGTRAVSHFAARKVNTPHYLENCIPLGPRDLDRQKPEIDTLRAKIRAAKQEQATPSPNAASGIGIAAELERLLALKDSGVLTDEEFERAKERLLSS